MKKLLILLVLAGLVSANTWAQTKAQNVSKSSNKDEISTYTVKADFKDQLSSVYEKSLSLTEAFIASNADEVKEASHAVKTSLSKVDMTLLSHDAHLDWMNYKAELDKNLDIIGQSEDIEVQRAHYAQFNDALYKSIKAFGVSDSQQVFYKYCPMAFGQKGAYWLDNNAQIRNPYFGDKMLSCGSVKESINK